MTFRGDPSWLADALAGTPKQATSIVQLVLDDHTSVVGTGIGSFSRFYLNGVQYLPADGLYTVNPSKNFRVLKAFASISNPTAAVARVTYYCHRSPAHTPGGELVELCINTVHIAPGDVVNIESTYDAETDALVLGGTTNFEPMFGLFSDTAGLKVDLNYLCATFAGTQNATAPSGGSSGGGVTPHPPAAIVQSSSTSWVDEAAPPASATVVFANPVAVGDVVAIAFGATQDAILSVSGLGVTTWNMDAVANVIGGDGRRYCTGVAWARATAAGTTVTLHFDPSHFLDSGRAVSWELSGVTTEADFSAMGATVHVNAHQSPPLDATANQVYVCTSLTENSGAISYTEIPGAFDGTFDMQAPFNSNTFHAAVRISDGVETISRTANLNSNQWGISASVLFN